MNTQSNNDIIGRICSVLAFIASTIGFFICWWLGFIGIFLGLIGLCADNKASGAIAIGYSILELVISIVVLSSLGIL